MAWGFYPLTRTRFSSPARHEISPEGESVKVASACVIYFGRQPGGRWRFVVDCEGFAEVGDTYVTKDELLANLPTYAQSWGFQ